MWYKTYYMTKYFFHAVKHKLEKVYSMFYKKGLQPNKYGIYHGYI